MKLFSCVTDRHLLDLLGAVCRPFVVELSCSKNNYVVRSLRIGSRSLTTICGGLIEDL